MPDLRVKTAHNVLIRDDVNLVQLFKRGTVNPEVVGLISAKIQN